MSFIDLCVGYDMPNARTRAVLGSLMHVGWDGAALNVPVADVTVATPTITPYDLEELRKVCCVLLLIPSSVLNVRITNMSHTG
jgi:hypothetical protein